MVHGLLLVISDAEYVVGMRCFVAPSTQAELLLLSKNDSRARVDHSGMHMLGLDHATHDFAKECYLVDPASSHMLVSKIKPCMCKYELIQTVKLRMAH